MILKRALFTLQRISLKIRKPSPNLNRLFEMPYIMLTLYTLKLSGKYDLEM